MPRTKLCQDSSDSGNKGKATSKATTEVKAIKPTDDDIMSDFVVPDELRKQLEYPAQQKKRQLAVEHVEKKLVERLATINTRLKQDNVKVSVQRQGSSLVLECTLPVKPGKTSKHGRPNEQTKISLGIPFSVDGLKTAEEEARELGTLIARKTFVWNEKYLGKQAVKTEVVPTIGELLEQFESKYFEKRKKTRQSENTFKTHLLFLKRFLCLSDLLTKETILKVLQKTESGTSSRTHLTSAMSVFCNTFNFEFNFKGYKDGYKPEKRIIPTDKEIEEKFHNFEQETYRKDFQWQAYQWIYGMLATYGLRPHEVFAIHIEDFTNPSNTLHEVRLDETTTEGVKTGERTIFPLHPEWVELFDLKNVKILENKRSFKSKTESISKSFLKTKIGFSPYNLRHAYAIRGHELGIPIKEMADNMGHSVDMHTKTYQKYMTMDTRRIVYQNAINKATEAKVEQTEMELLKAENARLKAEVEQLRALLTERQLNKLLSD